jgi:MinD superfamily P-loop ATPase
VKQLTILSGKGGTGKTTLTASFAALAKNVVIADCDVDAPDLHLLLHPEVIETQKFSGSKIANIDREKCLECSICRQKCRFGAITETLQINPIACEGCGVYISKTKYGFMSHALLNPSEGNSGKLVTLVRQNANILAKRENSDFLIIDGPPGIGCPVIASVTGVDAGLVVTEPTISGIHDLKRALQLIEHFDVMPFVCINMYDINIKNTEKITSFCREHSVEVIGRIPFDAAVTEAMVRGKTIVEYMPEGAAAKEIKNVWEKIFASISRN